MCGRYTLTVPTFESLAALLGVPFDPVLAAMYKPRYNVAPTDSQVIVRIEDGEQRFAIARWGLVPRWSSDARGGAKNINARSETVATKPSFRDPFKRTRCLVPADGFYEWMPGATTKAPRTPHWFHPSNGGLWLFAGLFDDYRDASTGTALRTFTILTTAANDVVAPVHDRMPVILSDESARTWLAPRATPDALEAILKPLSNERVASRVVNARVGSVKNDDAACLEPESHVSRRDDPPAQIDLFADRTDRRRG
jgi:putative SOS response-associated peptidase YedK